MQAYTQVNAKLQHKSQNSRIEPVSICTFYARNHGKKVTQAAVNKN